MRYYKNNLDFNTTSVQRDFAVIGESFFLYTVITCHLLKQFGRAGLLNKINYSNIMDDLSLVQRIVNDKARDKLIRNDRKLVHTINMIHDILEKLKLSIGRNPKN